MKIRKKVDGKHILATVSLKLPEDEKELNDETKVKVVLSVFNEETKTYENKQITTSYKKLSEDLFKQNTKSVSNSIKKYKDSAKDIFNKAELAKKLEKEEKVNNVEYDLIDDALSR